MEHYISFSSSNSHNFDEIVNGNSVKLHILYNYYLKTYYINVDIYRDEDYVNIISGLQMTTGTNLLSQWSYLNLGSLELIPMNTKYLDSLPTPETIMENYILVWDYD